jgi:hypothetical protein
VTSGQDGRAFRAQLVVPEQRQLFDYWLHKGAAGQLPRRADIKPGDIPRLLSGISLLEVGDSICNTRIRLAGTRLRDVYDREITGLRLKDLDWCDKHAYWEAAYQRTIGEALPTQGVVIGPRQEKEHLVQYWLRLPLSDNAKRVAMVLCYDHFMSAADAQDEGLAATA